MDRVFGHSWKSLRDLVSGQSEDSLHHLPNCGTYALHEAFQRPIRRRRTYRTHDIKKICHNKDALDRYIGNLSAYCKHTSSSRNAKANTVGSDYDISLHLLEQSCPNLLDEEHLDLKRRQVSVGQATSTATATNTVTPTTTAADTAASSTITQESTTVVGGTNSTPTGTTTSAALPTSPDTTSSTGTGTGTATSNQSSVTGPSSGLSSLSSSASSRTTGTGTTTGSGSSPSGSTSTSTSSTAASAPPKVSTLLISSQISVAPFAMAASVSASITNPVVSLPTSTYSGQALLTADCAVPAYTALPLADGSFLAAPMVGCAQGNPHCCPSLSGTSSGAQPSITQSIIPINQANQQLVSALNSAPLTLCPADYTSTAGNCCPVGFSLYNQQLLGQTPCYSVLPATLSVPAQVSAQISSMSAAIAATATAANPTVSVHIVTDEIFALSLPLKGGIERIPGSNDGLSLGAKIGIGVGGGLGAIIAVTLLVWLFFYVRKDRRNRHNRAISNDSDITAWVGKSGTATAASQRKSLASTTTAMASDPAWSPKHGHQSYADDEYIPGPNDSPWKPGRQSYMRMPPQRTSLQPMPTAHAANHQSSGQSRYSELPATDNTYFEADSHERPPYDAHPSQQELSAQPAARYELADNPYGTSVPAHGSYGSTNYYPPPPDRHEMGNSTPAPRWMQ